MKCVAKLSDNPDKSITEEEAEADCRAQYKALVDWCYMIHISSLLPMLLPLDIDMQALEMVWKDEGRKSDAVKYLDDMVNGYYKDKFKKIMEQKKNITDESLKNRLNKIIGDDENGLLHGFLGCLDEKKGKNLVDKDVEEVVGYFKKQNENYSFHAWYCELASCVRQVR
jgi:hypothetical protein